jgi:hypothetical protein
VKKHLFLLLLFSSPFFAFSQNWQMVNSGWEQWYEGSNDYLKVIVTDSVRLVGADSILYFPVTLGTKRLNTTLHSTEPANLFSPWWIGSKCIIKPDGKHIFFNAENDSLVFYPLKTLHDEWIVVMFSDSSYVKAEITSVHMQNIGPFNDAVKNIQLRRYSNTNVLTMIYPMITIGKSFGLIEVFPFFSILKDSSMVYEINTTKYTLNSYFLSFKVHGRLLNSEVYDYMPGDAFQYISGPNLVKTKILAVQYFGDSTKYSVEKAYQHFINSTSFALDSVRINDWWINNWNKLFTDRYPEQYEYYKNARYDEFYYSLNNCFSFNITRTSQPITKYNGIYSYNLFEPSRYKSTFTDHIGMVDSSLVTHDGLMDYKYTLAYLKNVYCSFGTPLGLSNGNQKMEIELYPNPGGHSILITSAENIEILSILDISGRTQNIPFQLVNPGSYQFDVSDLKAGIYTVLVNSKFPLRFIKK